MKTIEEICVKCRKEIHEGEGRYRFGGGTLVHCEACGDEANDMKNGVIL